MKLTVVILNWNGKNDTVACLKSLPAEISTVVVDNGSTDDSVNVISQEFPQVTLLKTGKNLGYAGGNNVGIEHALAEKADLVLLLNNDTIVDESFISALKQAAEKNPECGIFGAYPLRYSDPEKLDHLGGVWNRETASFDLIGLGAPDGFRTDQPLDYVCGCSILIRAEVFKTIGFLEPTFFLFWEEADFCVRAKKAGFGIDICYEAKLLHKVSASFVGGSPHKTYFWWRGRCLWIERNCTPEEKQHHYKTALNPELIHLFKLRWIKQFELFFLQLLRKQNLERKKNKLLEYRAALQAFSDYQHHKFGPEPSWLMKR